MSVNDNDPIFPPFNEIDAAGTSSGLPLRRALARILGPNDWNGVPDNMALASALRSLINRRAGSFGETRLIETLVDALEAKTKDGWRLELIGPKGPRKTFDQQEVINYIGFRMVELRAEGILYDAARAQVKAERKEAGQIIHYTEINKAYKEVKEWLHSMQALAASQDG